jgi:thiol-disulfide isomerase/thioredoxin
MVTDSARPSLPLVLRGLVLVALIGGLAAWLVVGPGGQRILESLPGNAPRPVEVGNPAPDFRLATPAGSSLALSDLRDKVVVLNFWATWCVPCRAEMPALENIYQELGPQGLVVVGVDVQESAEKVLTFLPEVGVTFPIVLDGDTRLAARYRATGLPATFIVDRKGTVRDIRLGPYTEDMLVPRLQPLLDER